MRLDEEDYALVCSTEANVPCVLILLKEGYSCEWIAKKTMISDESMLGW